MKCRSYLPFVFVFFLSLGACAIGGWHTPDLKLEQNFVLHEAEFQALLAQVNADSKLDMLRDDMVHYGGGVFSIHGDTSRLAPLGLSGERWAAYNEQLRRLGIAQITKGEGSVEFRVDTGSLMNGDSYKGYEYSPTPPPGRPKVSLDSYRISDADKSQFGGYYAYKPLKGNWYLYLFISP